VAGGVGEDPEALLALGREPAGAKGQHRPLGPVDVLDPDVQVELLGAGAGRATPAGRNSGRTSIL
jgi:hypothetical protein